MPIHEFYCPDNHRIYQFYARTLAQGAVVPPCPDNPTFRMRKIPSTFAVVGKGLSGDGAGGDGAPAEDPRMESAMARMESEFAHVDENDPKAMGRMMRRMADMTGEKMEGEMEEVVRKLEEGADPESLEEQLGGDLPEGGPSPGDQPGRKGRSRRASAPDRDPKLYDYP